MTRDPIIEEIRRAQSAIRRARDTDTPDAPTGGVPDDVRGVIGELFSRLEATQDHLMRTIQERTSPADTPTTASPAGAGSVAENERLETLEGKIERWFEGTGSAARQIEPVLDRLDAIEHRLRNGAPGAAAEIDLAPIQEEIRALGASVSAGGEGGSSLDPELMTSLGERLDAIEERLGGDAGAMTLGAAISRVTDSLERIEGTVASASGGSGGGAGIDPELVGRLETALENLPAAGDEDPAAKAISTLKRDFSLLVHTINGHLQESRHRSEKVESALEAIHRSLGPIAEMAGVELTPEPEGEPA